MQFHLSMSPAFFKMVCQIVISHVTMFIAVHVTLNQSDKSACWPQQMCHNKFIPTVQEKLGSRNQEEVPYSIVLHSGFFLANFAGET